MKKSLLLLGCTLAWLARAFSAETLQLTLQPDQRLLLTGAPREVVVKINLAAATARGTVHRAPINLAAVLDRSGSMAGAKLEKAKQGVLGLIDQLTADDTFALVVYDSTVQVLVPAQHLEDRDALKRRIERIQPGGSTALYDGVERGAAELEKFCGANKISRVLLLSDGLANIGPSSVEDLRGLGRRLAQRGFSVSTIGVGDDYNEDLMAGLAEASDANYYYVRDAEKLPEIFAKELGQLLTVTARDIRLEISCPDDVEPMDLIGRSEKFSQRQTVVQLSPFAAGQNRYLFLRCKIPAGQAVGIRDLATVKLTYLDELNAARVQTVTQAAQIGFTKNTALAADSVDPSIVAQRELQRNALVKDSALAKADAGQHAEAAQVLQKQADQLEVTATSVPAEYRPQLEAEVKNARQRAAALARAPLSSSLRKEIQNESYQQKNAKE